MSKHADLLARHRKVMPDWMLLYYDQPIALVDGEGRRVVDAEGNQYLDFFGGILVTMSGYRVPSIVEAIKAQADRMLHTSTLYLIEQQIELAERIAALSGIPDARVFFTSSGTEANDAALMLATQHTGSNQILAFRGSYHGRSHSTVGVTGQRSWSATANSPFNVTYIYGGYRLRSPFGHLNDDDYIAACVADLNNMIEVSTAGQVAAMIMEPIQGVAGFVTPPDGLLNAFKEVLDGHGILTIADEVQTGWGRTGEHFWGFQAHDLVPDMFTFAKGIGNGLAIGGVVASADIMDAFQANSISTFGGNPLATAGALANLDFILENDLQTNALKVGNRLKAGLEDIADEIPEIVEVRGRGLMLALELADPDSLEPDRDLTAAVMEQAKSEGLLIGKGGLYGNSLRIAPALTLTEEEADEGLSKLRAAFTKAKSS